MSRLRWGTGVLMGVALAIGLLFALRPLRAGDEKKALVPAAELRDAFDTLRRAIGERAGREGALSGAAPTPAPSTADAVSRPALATSFSDKQLEGLLQSVADDVRILEAGLLQYRDKTSDLVIVRNHNESGVRFRYARTGGKWSLESMNKWNQEKRLTKAYLDVDRDPTLEMDVVVAGGLTLDSIRESLSLFDYSVTAFRDHLAQTNEAK